MTEPEAKEILTYESSSSAGIVVSVRMGNDPGPERFDRVLAALRVVYDSLGDSQSIDRRLAYALFGLANYAEAEISSWEARGKKWRPRLLEVELPNLLLAVESVFSGEWIGDEDENE